MLALRRYEADLPSNGRDGNILLADDLADVLRDLKVEFGAILPSSFAHRLGRLLDRHAELRVYYLDTAAIDEAIRSTPPLPLPPEAAVAEIAEAINQKARRLSRPRRAKRSTKSFGHGCALNRMFPPLTDRAIGVRF